ncbi:MAG: M28 family peptidase [Candidatus Paceibacterota bacterium]
MKTKILLSLILCFSLIFCPVFAESTFEYTHLFSMSETELVSEIQTYLSANGYSPLVGKGNIYIYSEGDIPILLVAHTDTVHETLPEVIFEQDILTSKTGLGADDRAGVSAIFEVINRGYKPYVLFCSKEEIGLLGAKYAVDKINPKVNILIELDGKGKNNYYTYAARNDQANKYIESFGFVFKDAISATDICALMPEWNIYGANLSVGYYKIHTANEYMVISEWNAMVDRVCSILGNPPKYKYDYFTIAQSKEVFKDYIGYLQSKFREANSANDIYAMRNYAIAADEYRVSIGAARQNKKYIERLTLKLEE